MQKTYTLNENREDIYKFCGNRGQCSICIIGLRGMDTPVFVEDVPVN